MSQTQSGEKGKYELAKEWQTKGNNLLKSGQYEEVIEALDKAIEIDPSDDFTWF